MRKKSTNGTPSEAQHQHPAVPIRMAMFDQYRSPLFSPGNATAVIQHLVFAIKDSQLA
jgi:hypothetical protein